MSRIKLFTHNDLDGVGCSIIANLAYGADQVDVEYCNYDNIDKRVVDFVESEEYKDYSYVYITDISISMKTARFIDSIVPEIFDEGFGLSEMFQLLDHHNTALELNEFFWCSVKEYNNENDYKASGTYMFYNHLVEIGVQSESGIIYEFADLVRQYDTWEWKRANNVSAKELNNLFYILGINRFVDKFTSRLSQQLTNQSELELFDDNDIVILEIERDRVDRYITSKARQLVEVNMMGYKVGVVFAEQHISELGDELSGRNPDLNFVAIVNIRTQVNVSLRTNRDDIDLGNDVASLYGGGGHQKAAGFALCKTDKLLVHMSKIQS